MARDAAAGGQRSAVSMGRGEPGGRRGAVGCRRGREHPVARGHVAVIGDGGRGNARVGTPTSPQGSGQRADRGLLCTNCMDASARAFCVVIRNRGEEDESLSHDAAGPGFADV